MALLLSQAKDQSNLHFLPLNKESEESGEAEVHEPVTVSISKLTSSGDGSKNP